MLIHFKTSFKTSVLLLLFIVGTPLLYAGKNLPDKFEPRGFIAQVFVFSTDTVSKDTLITNKEIIQKPEYAVPDSLSNKTINFQVNSRISYLRFSNFRNDESKKLFLQAWEKEKEVKHLSAKTDSLRKAYLNSSFDQKAEVSNLILRAEERLITLNEEIPAMYEKARNLENQYWQSAPDDEIAKFQEKINNFKDSIRKMVEKPKIQSVENIEKNQDTITFYQSGQNPVKKEFKPSEITYKIQIIAYKTRIPDSAAKAIKKLSLLRKVDIYKDENGVTFYTTGNLKSYQEAIILQAQVKQEGIKNPSITAYQQGKKITLDEAKKINNGL